jgi:hypothetical protein
MIYLPYFTYILSRLDKKIESCSFVGLEDSVNNRQIPQFRNMQNQGGTKIFCQDD